MVKLKKTVDKLHKSVDMDAISYDMEDIQAVITALQDKYYNLSDMIYSMSDDVMGEEYATGCVSACCEEFKAYCDQLSQAINRLMKRLE